MSGHTATPWSYKRAKFPTDGEFDCGISANIGGTPFCIAETFGRCATTIKLDAEANAAFIVTACNSHADLVKALEEIASENTQWDWSDKDTPEIMLGKIAVQMRKLAKDALATLTARKVG